MSEGTRLYWGLPRDQWPEWIGVFPVAGFLIFLALVVLHAWMVLHYRKHHCPPMFMLRLWQWWHGSGPGRMPKR